MTIPNIITLGRLLSVPVIVWVLLSGFIELGFWLFMVAAVSDGVDGFIAKRFNSASALGAYLDPIADKVLLVSIYISLGQANLLPLWLVILVVSRDILIVGAVILSFAMDQHIKMSPLMISKINTFAQIGLATIVMSEGAFNWSAGMFGIGLIMVVAVSTVMSGSAYMFNWIRATGGEQGNDR